MHLRTVSLALALVACGPPEAPRGDPEDGPRYCALAQKLAEEGRCLEAGEQLAHCKGKGEVAARAAAQEHCAPRSPDPVPDPDPVAPSPDPYPVSPQPPSPQPPSPQPPRPQPPQPQPPLVPTGSVHKPQPFPPVPSRIPPFPTPKPPDPLEGRQ
jgi:hypothetical protein